MRTMPALVLCALATSSAWGQTGPPADLRFEVASIKPNASVSTAIGSVRFQPGGRYTASNIPLDIFVEQAFGLRQMSLLIGLPDWTASSKFDIAAKASIDTPTDAQQRTLLQTLLADRFKMVAHRETKEIPVYVLQLARSDHRLGPHLYQSDIDCQAVATAGKLPALRAAAPTRCTWGDSPNKMFADSQRLQILVLELSPRVDRPIIDRRRSRGDRSY